MQWHWTKEADCESFQSIYCSGQHTQLKTQLTRWESITFTDVNISLYHSIDWLFDLEATQTTVGLEVALLVWRPFDQWNQSVIYHFNLSEVQNPKGP